MAWTEPEHSKSRVKSAGKILSGRKLPHEGMSLDMAMDVVGNWRSSHGCPLQPAYVTLRNRARKLDDQSIIAQRLKRMPSIKGKIQREHTMPLSNMQDLGGCRAIVHSLANVRSLVETYRGRPPDTLRIDWDKSKDYINTPCPPCQHD